MNAYKSVNAVSKGFFFVRAANNVFVLCKRNRAEKPLGTLFIFIYLTCFTLSRMHGRDAAPEKESDIAILMTLERLLVLRSKQNRNCPKRN